MKKIFPISLILLLTIALILVFNSRQASADSNSIGSTEKSGSQADNITAPVTPATYSEDDTSAALDTIDSKTERVQQLPATNVDLSKLRQYMKNRQYQDAIDYMNSWPLEHRETFAYYRDMGFAYVYLKDWENAEHFFEEAVKESPQDPIPNFNSLEMSFVQKKWDTFLEKAARFEENASGSRKNLDSLVEFKKMIAFTELGEEDQLRKWKAEQQSLEQSLQLEVITALELIKNQNYAQADAQLDMIYTVFKEDENLAFYTDSLQEMGYLDWETK